VAYVGGRRRDQALAGDGGARVAAASAWRHIVCDGYLGSIHVRAQKRKMKGE